MRRSIWNQPLPPVKARVKVLAAVCLTGALLLTWLANTTRRAEMPLVLSGIVTNAHGLREYEFTLDNGAWDCLIDVRARVCAAPDVAHAKAKWHQGARIWPKMQMVDSGIHVTSSTGSFLARGQTAVFRLPEPGVAPWMLGVYCVRTNTSGLLQAVAAANQALSAQFGFPVLVTVETASHRFSPLIEPP